MNPKKLFLLVGALFLAWAANAQSTGNNSSADTSADTSHITHHRSHRAPDDYAFHRPGAFPGQNHFHHGHGRSFDHRQFIHYTPEQWKQVMAIRQDFQQKREDLFKQDNITLKEYKAGLLALDRDQKAKLQALLTPQQKEEVAARRKRMADNRQVMQAAHLERLRLALNLTDDQVVQIKTGQQNIHNQAEAIHTNSNLLPQEKHQQMRALMISRNDSFKSILTPDQYNKFQQLMSHHRRGFGGTGGGISGGTGGYNGPRGGWRS